MARHEIDPALRATIKAELKGETEVNKDDPNALFYQTAPEGMTKEIFEKADGHVRNFSATAIAASGEVAAENFLEDEKLQEVDFNIGLGSFGKAEWSVNREREVAVVGKKGETSIVRGGTSVKMDFVAGRNVGLMAAARAEVKKVVGEALEGASKK
jgi:hypothetical protein